MVVENAIRPQTGKNAGIAKVLVGSGPRHAGMGIACDPLHVVTCAHVVNVALGRQPTTQERPTENERVVVNFPMTDEALHIKGKVIEWRPAGETPQDDIAVLALEKPVPGEVGLAIPVIVTGTSIDGDALSVFGLAGSSGRGNHIDAKFMGPSRPWGQIDGTSASGAFVQGGFSGGAVWDIPQSGIVGMIVARKGTPPDRIAYMNSTEDMYSFWRSLPVEMRGLSASFNRTWTILAGLFFFLILGHFMTERGAPVFHFLTIYGANKPLAAFFGMHIFAFLAPVVLGMLLVYARSFRLHDWKDRVPSFGSFLPGPRSAGSRLTAVLSLVAFVALPLYAQGHFLRNFHDDGNVYIDPGRFGYQAAELTKCSLDTVHWCTHPDAGRYSLVTARPGAEGGYWDNAYHYGNRHEEGGKSVTFFPILQPVIINILTALSVLLAGWALFSIFRPRAWLKS